MSEAKFYTHGKSTQASGICIAWFIQFLLLININFCVCVYGVLCDRKRREKNEKRAQ